jgi:hypothetical protein
VFINNFKVGEKIVFKKDYLHHKKGDVANVLKISGPFVLIAEPDWWVFSIRFDKLKNHPLTTIFK